MDIADTQGLQSVGWSGFLDLAYMVQSLGALSLSTVLGLLIAYHPNTRRMVDTIEEAELPKVQIMCALIGAMVGIIVLEYGLVVGFVIFGLGGLMRFRTVTGTTRDMSRIIIVTLIGLIAGLNLPHFAVLSAAYAWVLIFVDGRPIFSIEVNEIPKGKLSNAASAYQAAFAETGCTLISEHKYHAKRRIRYVIRGPRKSEREGMESALAEKIPSNLRGDLDWEVR